MVFNATFNNIVAVSLLVEEIIDLSQVTDKLISWHLIHAKTL
jgi:hypothetical protein